MTVAAPIVDSPDYLAARKIEAARGFLEAAGELATNGKSITGYVQALDNLSKVQGELDRRVGENVRSTGELG